MNDRPEVNSTVSEKGSREFQVAQAELPSVDAGAQNAGPNLGPNLDPSAAPVPVTVYPQGTANGPWTVDKGPVDLARIKQTIVPVAGKPVVLPDDLQLSGIMVSGDDLVLKAANGDLIVIQGGLKALPSLVIGTVEIPAGALLASLQVGGVTLPAAGGQTAGADAASPAAPGSSGGNFARGPGGIGDVFQISDLLDFSERGRGTEKNKLEEGFLKKTPGQPNLPPNIAQDGSGVTKEFLDNAGNENTGSHIVKGSLQFEDPNQADTRKEN